MVKVIEIENCWMITEYNNHNSDKIKNGQLPPGDVFMVYFLRFIKNKSYLSRVII